MNCGVFVRGDEARCPAVQPALDSHAHTQYFLFYAAAVAGWFGSADVSTTHLNSHRKGAMHCNGEPVVVPFDLRYSR